MMLFFYIILILQLLIIGFVNGGEARCDTQVPGNTTDCICTSHHDSCSFPSCVDNCKCLGYGCDMPLCLTNCICLKGGCNMKRCRHKCENGNDTFEPPVCISTLELAPSVREMGMTPFEVCKQEHGDIGATTPYVCTKQSDNVKYACCTGDLDTITNYHMNLGICKKSFLIEDQNRVERLGDMEKATYRQDNNVDLGYTGTDRSIGYILTISCLTIIIVSLGIFIFFRGKLLTANFQQHTD